MEKIFYYLVITLKLPVFKREIFLFPFVIFYYKDIKNITLNIKAIRIF